MCSFDSSWEVDWIGCYMMCVAPYSMHFPGLGNSSISSLTCWLPASWTRQIQKTWPKWGRGQGKSWERLRLVLGKGLASEPGCSVSSVMQSHMIFPVLSAALQQSLCAIPEWLLLLPFPSTRYFVLHCCTLTSLFILTLPNYLFSVFCFLQSGFWL